LWIGQSISLFGDQFYLIALSWLTLSISKSGIILGTVLMIAGLSQALFQLVGGAVGDRVSPRTLMLGSDILRAAITAVVTLIIFLDSIQVWHLYVIAGLFGAVEAFFYPAYMSAIPMLVAGDHLPAGNALLRGTRHLMGFVGRPVAGLVIRYVGLYVAFAIDAMTFVIAGVTLWMMRLKKGEAEGPASAEERSGGGVNFKSLFRSIGEGLHYTWGNRLIRSLLLFIAVIEFSFVGPSSVGLTVMADLRYGPEAGAAAYGWMLGAFGGGMFAGILIAGSLKVKQRRDRLINWTILIAGLGLALLSFSIQVVWAALIMAVVGLGGGVANITIMSWIQAATEPRVLARVVSLMLFSVSMLEPLSYYLAGVVADYNITFMFVGNGALMVLASLVSILTGSLRQAD
jgi:MFS family permease